MHISQTASLAASDDFVFKITRRFGKYYDDRKVIQFNVDPYLPVRPAQEIVIFITLLKRLLKRFCLVLKFYSLASGFIKAA